MSIIKDYKTVTDKWDLIQDRPGSISGNGVRYTCSYIYALHLENELTDERREKILKALNACEQEKGLLMRTPDNQFGQEGPDDYVARIAICKITNDRFARRFLEYGRNNKWLGIIPKYNYNNIQPNVFTLSSWIGRQQQIIAIAQMISNERVPGLRLLWFCISLLLSSFTSSQDGKVLGMYLYIASVDRKEKLIVLVRKLWVTLLYRKYKGGIGEVLGNYFNWPHPHSKYLKFTPPR